MLFIWRYMTYGRKGRKSVQNHKRRKLETSICCKSQLLVSSGWPDGGIRWSQRPPMEGEIRWDFPASKHPGSQPYGGLGCTLFISHLQIQGTAWGSQGSVFLPKATTLALGHFILLPKKLHPFRQEIKSDSAQDPGTNHLFTRNIGTEEHVQRHHGDPVNRTKNAGNFTGQVTTFFSEWMAKTEKGKGKSRNLRIKRDLKSINQMQ